MALTARQQVALPDHAFAIDHKVLEAQKRFGTKARLRLAKRKRSCAEVAAERIREFAWDLGADKGWDMWIAEAARRMGLSYTTTWNIVRGRKTRVGPDVVDQISQHTGVPVAVFYDEEV